jgi:chromosome segregation ATPase
MALKELQDKQIELQLKSNELRVKIQENTNAARKLNEENRRLIDERQLVNRELSQTGDEIRKLEEAANLKAKTIRLPKKAKA